MGLRYLVHHLTSEGIYLVVAAHPNLVEINGKKYDANSGKLLDSPVLDSVKRVVRQAPATVEGFVKKSVSRSKPHPKISAKSVHKKPAKSATLMRSHLAKPKAGHKPQTAIDIGHKSIDPTRLHRAKQTAQNKLIKHFSFSELSDSVKRNTAALQAKAAPAIRLPLPPLPTGKTLAKASSKADTEFGKALKKAKSHEQPKLKKAKISHRAAKKLMIKPRTLQTVGFLFAFLIIVGVVGHRYIPNVSVRYAATRAGIHAVLPGYHPDGYTLNNSVGYQAGQIKIGYHSTTDDRQYSVIQAASNWNSDSLAQNFIATNHYQAQTFQDNGRTIYLYNNGNATWVDGGIWYQVQSNSSLSSDQLIHIASSI